METNEEPMKNLMTDLTDLSLEIHEGNKARGFYDEERNVGEILALIHSEVSEALEAHRSGKRCEWDISLAPEGWGDEEYTTRFEGTIKDTMEDELADVLIRVLDLCGYLGVDIDSHLYAKLRYNSTRPYKHGKKY